MISWDENHKMTYPRFNLPHRQACPWATPECRRTCYNCKVVRFRPQVIPFRLQNLILAQSPQFANLLIAEFQLRRRPVPIFRIHESGDFFSLDYFKAWCRIARTFPATTFFAFTKGFHLFKLPRPKNLILIASVYYDEKRPVPRNVPRFYTVRKGDIGPGTRCHGKCDACQLCPMATKQTVLWTEVH